MSAYTKDMTSGSELKHIVTFALPMLAGNLFQQLYNIADSIIVGRCIGKNAFAAVGATSSMTFFFYSLCFGLGIGAGVLISQFFGARQDDNVKSAIANSAYITIAIGLIITVASVLVARPLLVLTNTPPDVIDNASAYMKVACGGTVAVALYNWINAVMRSLGDSKTPLIFLIVASILNVGLDLLFVVVFKTGVEGAAWATVISQFVSAIGSIAFAFAKNPYFRFSRDNLKPQKEIFVRCIKAGIPLSSQNAMIAVSMTVLQATANGFGDTIMAAYTATMRIEQLVQQPYQSLSAALSTFAGQNTGAGKTERVVRSYRLALVIVFIFSFIMLATFMLCGRMILGIFVKDPEVVDIGARALRFSACFYVFLGLIYISRGLLNGAGDVVYSMMNGFAEVVGRIGFSTALVRIPGVGIWAVWGTTCLTWVITGLMSFVRYKRKKWMHKSLLQIQRKAGSGGEVCQK